MSTSAPQERDAWIQTTGWAGRMETRVVVIGETPKRYRCRAVKRTKLAGRDRWVEAGTVFLVPKGAVSFNPLLGSLRDA